MTQKDVNLPFKFSSNVTFTVPPLQRYPTDIFKWIKKNANPRMLLKLMQVCKYFCYQKFPYLVTYSFDGFEEDIINYSIKSGYINKRMKYPCNKSLWITRVLSLKNFSSILPKLIESMIICDAKYIHLERIHVSFSDFKILTASGSVEILHCYENTMICDDSGNIAPLENILECLPKLERMVFSGGVPSLTTSDISKVKISPNIEYLRFGIMVDNFNFDNFLNFMKMYPKTQYSLEYFPVLSQDFTEKLQQIVNEIVKTGLTKFPPPEIEFTGQNKASLKALKELLNLYTSK